MFPKLPILPAAILILICCQNIVCYNHSKLHPHRSMTSYPLGRSTSVEREGSQVFHFPNRIFAKDEDESASDYHGQLEELSRSSSESESDRKREDASDMRPGVDDNGSSEVLFGHRGLSLIAKRRNGPTLSVVNPLEILRHRLMLDMARRRIQENQHQIMANAELLENLGKRSIIYRSDASRTSEDQRNEDFQR